MKFLLLLILVSAASLYIVACTAMGSNPSGARATQIQSSKQFNAEQAIFQNTKVIPVTLGRPWYEILYDFISNGENRRPASKLPEAPPGLVELEKKSHPIRFIWFGHSTILIEIEGKRILIDPVFSDYASPIPGIAERFQPPVFTIDEIESIDLVLISHDHYDHLDHETITQLKERVPYFITPLGVGSHLEYWGIKRDQIKELDWWESINIQGLDFTCTPSQHFSGRGLFNRNSTLWASWAIKSNNQNIFFSGDSGYSDHYKTIGNRLGPFDIAFLENGAYNLDWKFVHQLPEEGVQASIDLKSETMVPVHWGMFDLALHSWYEPIVRVTTEAHRRGISILTPKLGQIVSLDHKPLLEAWWQPLIDEVNND